MPRFLLVLVGPLCFLACSACSADPHSLRNYTLSWQDEFNAPDNSLPDPSKWTYDLGVGGQGWGNHELEYYTDRPQNAYIKNGNLVISAREERYTDPHGVTRSFTSARLKTQNLFSQAYGRFEARIKIPAGQGIWPAFWLLGNNFPSVGWPRCGEIDIMENVGKEPGTVHGSLHGPVAAASASDVTAAFHLPPGKNFSDDFHVYAVEWEPAAVRFYADSTLYATFMPQSPGSGPWIFDHPFFIILNVAVGGAWPGNPDPSTKFPQSMLVDYVRVYSTKR